MPEGYATDPHDRRVLLVSDKGNSLTYQPIHKEDGRLFESEDALIPAGFVDADGRWRPGRLDASGNLLTSGSGGSGSSLITDIQDGAGDSIMDPALNAAQVSVINSATPVNVVVTGASPGVNDAGFVVRPVGSYTTSFNATFTNLKNRSMILFIEITAVGTGQLVPFVSLLNAFTSVGYLVTLGVLAIRNTFPVPIRYAYIFSPGVVAPALATNNGVKFVSPLAITRDVLIGITHVTTTTPWSYRMDAQFFG